MEFFNMKYLTFVMSCTLKFFTLFDTLFSNQQSWTKEGKSHSGNCTSLGNVQE